MCHRGNRRCNREDMAQMNPETGCEKGCVWLSQTSRFHADRLVEEARRPLKSSVPGNGLVSCGENTQGLQAEDTAAFIVPITGPRALKISFQKFLLISAVKGQIKGMWAGGWQSLGPLGK